MDGEVGMCFYPSIDRETLYWPRSGLAEIASLRPALKTGLNKVLIFRRRHVIPFLIDSRSRRRVKRRDTCHYKFLLPSVRCSFFDQSCNLLRPGDIDRVAGA
jgi:hypothetical protein